MRHLVLGLALGCPVFGPPKAGEPTTARWLGGDGPRPGNTHLFVLERWSSKAPPRTSFTLASKGGERVDVDDQVIDLQGRARVHEVVPRRALSPGAYVLEWAAEGELVEPFAFAVDAALDATPPVLEATRAEPVEHAAQPECGLRQSWRSATIPAATDDVVGGIVYLVWRAGEDGLVDFAAPATAAVVGAPPRVDLGPTPDAWLGVVAIDAAGRKTAPRELPIGVTREDARLRPLKLWVRRASDWLIDNPAIAGGALFGVLLVVSFGFHRREKLPPKPR